MERTSIYVFSFVQFHKKPFDDVRVRKALNLAVDRQALINNVLQSADIPASALVPQGYVAGGKDFTEGRGDFDIKDTASIEEAKQLLADAGKGTSWTVHPIEHELSAHYDITHGEGLALLTPAFLTHILSDKTVNKISEFAYNVFDIEPTEDKFKDAKEGIDALYNFFKEMNIPMSLRELSIDDSLFEEMAEHALGVSTIETKSYVSLTKEDIVEIYRKAL